MPEFYRLSRGFPFVTYHTRREAEQLLAAAEADQHAHVKGCLEDPDGASYWGGFHESAGGLVRTRLHRVARTEIPVKDLVRLEMAAADEALRSGSRRA
jgi:hypothetical protein